MQLNISVIGGAADGLEVTLDQLPATLGREGDVPLPTRDRWASRHHCELFERDGELLIRDLASKHGTYVNGTRIDEQALRTGDRVMVGLTMLLIGDIMTSSYGQNDVLVDRESGVGA